MRKYINQIVERDNKEDMQCLSDILIDALYDLKEVDPNKYHKYKNKIKGMAYGYQLDSELAKEIVHEMKPLGEYWTMETLQSIIPNDNHRLCDMYVVINSLANDYKDVIPLTQRDTYIKMAHAWIDDVDAKEHKVWWYFVK